MKQVAKVCFMALGFVAYTFLPPIGATPLTDPTRPYDNAGSAGRQVHAASSLVLNSTLVSPNRRVAVINGQQVIEGETVGNATVLRIRKHSVVLRSPGKQITLQLLPDIVTTQP